MADSTSSPSANETVVEPDIGLSVQQIIGIAGAGLGITGGAIAALYKYQVKRESERDQAHQELDKEYRSLMHKQLAEYSRDQKNSVEVINDLHKKVGELEGTINAKKDFKTALQEVVDSTIKEVVVGRARKLDDVPKDI